MFVIAKFDHIRFHFLGVKKHIVFTTDFTLMHLVHFSLGLQNNVDQYLCLSKNKFLMAENIIKGVMWGIKLLHRCYGFFKHHVCQLVLSTEIRFHVKSTKGFIGNPPHSFNVYSFCRYVIKNFSLERGSTQC